jgi:adenosylhomocysteine nucleosidase
MQGDQWKIIEKVSKQLPDPIYSANWMTFWPPTGKQDEKAIPLELRSLIKKQGAWCIKANILIRMLEISLHRTLSNGISVEKIVKEAEKFCGYLKRYDKEDEETKLIEHVQRMREQISHGTLKPNKLRDFTLRELEGLGRQARPMLDMVDTIATEFGQPKRVTEYQHAMFINLRILVPGSYEYRKQADDIVQRFIIEAKLDSLDTHPTRLSLIPVGQGGFRHGQWVCAYGPMGRAWLIRLAKHLCKKLSPAADLRLILLAHLPENERILRAEGYAGYNGTFFWRRARAIIYEHLPEWHGTQFFFVSPSNQSRVKAVDKEVTNEDSLTLQSMGPARQVVINDPSPLGFIIKQYAHLRETSIIKSGLRTERVDVGIITIVTEETRAVKKLLEKSPGFKRARGLAGRRIFYEGQLPRAGGGYHRIVCTQQIDQGNRSMVSAYDALAKEYAPRLVILLGIGGSIHKDLDLCDVVIADQVIYYDKRKIGQRGEKRRGESYKISAWLKPMLNDFLVEYGEPAFFSTELLLPNPKFKTMIGPIGSGEAVVGFRDARERKWLSTVNDKTLALETEAGGLAQAFYEDQLTFGYKAEGYLVIRGISDHADKEKDDRWRQIASDNAVFVMVEFLKSVPSLELILRDEIA